MNKAAIYHRPESEFAFLSKDNLVNIRLRTALDDLVQVELYFGDPYDLSTISSDNENEDKAIWKHEVAKMGKVASTDTHDYYQVAVKLPHKRMHYLFVLTSKTGEKFIYTDRGLIDYSDERISEKYSPFSLPFFHDVDKYKTPEWVKSTVWYQIFPERFANGDKSNDPENVKDWEDTEKIGRGDFYGGDLQGIIDHLDHLTELGVNGLYLTPIFKAPSNHKYDTVDYMEIDPHFGDKATFKQLVEDCHARGIKVMLDAVFNHIGDKSLVWQDVLKNQEKSKYADWFHINNWPVGYEGTKEFEPNMSRDYETFSYSPHMPKLNTSNPEVEEYLLAVADYWIREFDIDGWRLDVANEVDHQFWKKFRRTCDVAKKDFYVVGEVWHSAQTWLNGDEFTAVMNYFYTDAILDYFVKNKLSMNAMVSQLNQQLMLYRDETNGAMFNILDSHDTERLLHACAEDVDLFKQVIAFTYLQPGNPCVYYGDEIGMTGGNDPDCRRPMNWDLENHNPDRFWFFHDLIALRLKNSDLLTMGTMNWQFVSEEKGLIQLKRKLGNKELTGTFNTGTHTNMIDLQKIRASNLAKINGNQIEIAAKGFVISES
ncbi:MAG: glycoside hydrolase family 13 protein [Streptococcaceae bacterium]|nr:glycoside hydrolase family 13 protein [Streptococcaceae bacterium]